jgi:long-chain acyl-CoA synthetase
MNETVFLTGATGFLGTQAARRLVGREGLRLVVLVRGGDASDAADRLRRTWHPWPELASAIGGSVEVLCGDVGKPRLGLDHADYSRLSECVTHIIHSAADLRLDGPVDELRAINVQGTAHVLDLAHAAHGHHGLARFSHVSTAYVAGKRTGKIAEQDLEDGHGFSNTYEQTKYEGERLVRSAASDLPLSVFRPGMIVGDSTTGEIATFNTVYVPLRLYLTGKLPVMPCRGDLPVNVVPVDYVAEAVARLTFDSRAEGKTFHLTVPPRLLPTAKELLQGVREWAAGALGVRLRPPLMVQIPPAALDRKILRAVPKALLSYFSEDRQFQTSNTESLLGPCTMDWKAVLPKLLSYAAARGFLHASGRTAHEQVVFRLQSTSRPVRFHEITSRGVSNLSGTKVREEILRAAAGLRALGVAHGDRVAISGLNGVRYLELDVALGLAGAVSVPLYYTTPAAEMKEIIEASRARAVFIGAPALFAELARTGLRLPTISFCGLEPPRGVMSWDGFLHIGSEAVPGPASDAGPSPRRDADASPPPAPRSPVQLSDEATLRFTSGTTGSPKGATFRHDQVRWLAETLASLLPWKARTSRASYLSFLPMSHVVEGILGTYAPYYLPAAVDVWFLEDFRRLAEALPRVRPTVFFSVPRFYEKLWDTFSSSPAGRLYSRLPDALSAAVRPVVRGALLRRAGLDRCAQLISGSAPASAALLASFQHIGITIHNAYGLTEAPLATLNIAGANRPGTVGAPLPQTQVRIAADGEVLLKGPQVTAGYDGSMEQPFRDGWLLTGDLGHLEAGSLVLDGRKKDLIVTSYGKNIHPGKIEALLKGIPGVVEAMVIGEGRPFCSALLWVRRDFGASLDDAISTANTGLSHPEQVKKWTVLPHDLTIEGGELTGNLKLKRAVVSLRFGTLIERMYAGAERKPA